MKKTLRSMAVVMFAVMISLLCNHAYAATLVQKNAYAYNITVAQVYNSVYRVAYNLSGAASAVTIEVYQGSTLRASYAGGTAQTNLVTIDLRRDKNGNAVPTSGAALSVKVKVTSALVSSPRLIEDATTGYNGSTKNGVFRFFAPWSVAVNNCPDSETFGRVLVTETKNYSWTGSTVYHSGGGYSNNKGRGPMVYAFDPQMQPIYNNDGKGYGWSFGMAVSGSTYANGGESMHTYQCIRYSEDGRLFLATADDTKAYQQSNHYAFYELNPNSLNDGTTSYNTYRFHPINLLNNDGTALDKIIAFDTKGKGSNLKLVVLHNKNGAIASSQTAKNTSSNHYWSLGYNLGNANGSSNVSRAYNCTDGGLAVNFGQKVAMDPGGKGYLVTAGSTYNGSAYTGNGGFAHHIFSGSATTVEHALGPFGGANHNYGPVAIAWNPHGNLIAFQGGTNNIQVYNASVNSNGNISYGGLVCEINMQTLTGLSHNRICDIAFDYANNIYVTTNSGECVSCVQLPNSGRQDITVPAPSNYGFPVATSNASISASYANGKVSLSWSSSANDPSKKYNVQVSTNNSTWSNVVTGTSSTSTTYNVTLSTARTLYFKVTAYRKNISTTTSGTTISYGSNDVTIGTASTNVSIPAVTLSGLTPTNNQTSVALSWAASYADSSVSYNVYRGNTLVANTTSTSYSVPITEAGNYTFTVKPKVGSTELTGVSTSSMFCTGGATVAISGSDQGNGNVSLSWSTTKMGSVTPTYYVYRDGTTEIYRGTGTTHTDVVNASGTYTYRVEAYTGSTLICQSTTISVTANLTPVLQLNCSYTDGTPNVHLSWTVTNAVGTPTYTIYRNGEAVATGLTGSSYDDVLPGPGYYIYELCGEINDGTVFADEYPELTYMGGSLTLVVSYDSTENDEVFLSWETENLATASSYKLYRDGVLFATIAAPSTSFIIGDPDNDDNNPDDTQSHEYYIVAICGGLEMASSNTVMIGHIKPQFEIVPEVGANEYGNDDILRFMGNLEWSRPMTCEFTDAADGHVYVLSHYEVQLLDDQGNPVNMYYEDAEDDSVTLPTVLCNGSAEGVTVTDANRDGILEVNDPITTHLIATRSAVRRKIEGEADPLAATFTTTFENDDITFGTYTAKVTPMYVNLGDEDQVASGAEASNTSEQSKDDFVPVSNLAVNAYYGTVKAWTEDGVLYDKNVYRSDIFFAKPDTELPVSFYTIEYKRSGQAEFSLLEDFWVIWGDDQYHYKAGETDLDDYEVPVPGATEKAPRRVAKVPTLDEKTDFANNVAQGYILGSYDFTDGPQKAVPDASTTAVAFHYSDVNPTDTEYKVTAYYGAPNAYLLAAQETNKSKVVGLNGGLIPTGVQAIEGDFGQLSAWPIPAHDVVNVQAPAAITKVEVYSTTGAMVKSIAADGQSSRATIDITDLPAGLYLLQVNDEMYIRIIKK